MTTVETKHENPPPVGFRRLDTLHIGPIAVEDSFAERTYFARQVKTFCNGQSGGEAIKYGVLLVFATWSEVGFTIACQNFGACDFADFNAVDGRPNALPKNLWKARVFFWDDATRFWADLERKLESECLERVTEYGASWQSPCDINSKTTSTISIDWYRQSPSIAKVLRRKGRFVVPDAADYKSDWASGRSRVGSLWRYGEAEE